MQAANEIYERKLDVDNEQTEQVDEKRKRVPQLPEAFSGFVDSLHSSGQRSRMDFFQELNNAWQLDRNVLCRPSYSIHSAPASRI